MTDLAKNYKKLSLEYLKWVFEKSRFKTEPMLHQYQVLAFCLDQPRAGLILGVGCGKTLTALYAAKVAGSRCVLVICPNSVVNTWCEQLEEHTDFSYVTLTGTRNERKRKLESPHDFYIINYEGLKTLWSRVCTSSFTGKTKHISDPSLTKDSPFDCVIVDEAHHVARHTSIQTKIAANLTAHADNVFVLTGTPIRKSLLDLWGIMYVVDNGETFGNNYFAYRSKYFKKCGYKWALRRGAQAKILDLIGNKLIGYSRDECFDLPPVSYQTRYVKMTDEQCRVESDFLHTLKTEVDAKKVTAANILVRCTKLAQVNSGFIINGDGIVKLAGRNPKLDELDECLKEISAKIIIFHRYTEEAHDIEKLLKKRCIKFASMRGEIKDKNNEKNRFKTNPNVRVMVCNPQVGGEGVDGLQKAASVCLFYSRDYEGATARRQAEGRIYRKGQTEPCLFIDIVTEDSVIEGEISFSMMTKQQIADIVLARVQKKV